MALLALAASAASPAVAQNVRPPKVQLWIDASTGGMAGMPEMDGLQGGMGGMIAGMMGGGGGAAGGARGAQGWWGQARTPHVMPARVLDLALESRIQPGAPAQQFVPAGLRMGESLPLIAPAPSAPPPPRESEPGDVPADVEPPKGRILIYWGCGTEVRPGQPRVIDLARGNLADFARAFAGRYVPERGPRVGPSTVFFPNEQNQQTPPRGGSLVGEHRVQGAGVPASMKFSLGPAQDLMPAIELQTQGRLTDAVALSWRPVAQARAYFLHAMGSVGKEDMVLWSSAETPDTGMGLFDYLPNATLERWTQERVLLAPQTTQCSVPRGIFAGSEGAMLRMIAWGASHFAYPPRPADPKAVWEPEWAVRVRTKSHTLAMLGEDGPAAAAAPACPPMQAPRRPTHQTPSAPPPSPLEQLTNPANLLKGLFGR
ncbi:MAG: hypothetical protein HZY78_06295 [Burkholderiaceae bacterium]|nr:MAG: hypothetical protein HZY78_06295 [Burkholderiaceae bacterium]